MSGCSAPAAPAADWRVPSRVRSFRIYSGQNALSPTRAPNPLLYKWPPKHPLDLDGWWINAQGWCEDIRDRIGQIACPPTLPDPALSIVATAISTDGLQAGILFAGGTPGAFPKIRIVLTGAATGIRKAVDVVLPIEDVAAVQPNPPGVATLHGSVVTIGGLRFPTAS